MHDAPRSPRETPSVPARVRAKVHARRALLLRAAVTLLVVLFAALAAGASTPPRVDAAASFATGPQRPVRAVGSNWFALGASLPWFQRGCDFGCGNGRGVLGNTRRIDSIFQRMSRRGVRVVRWELFPSQAWQVRRDATTGMPTSLAPGVQADFDEAVRLARRHDLFLLPVVFPDPERLPATWYTDDAQSAKLAAVLRPLFARYRAERHVLGWELVSGAERVVDWGIASRDDARRHARHLHDALALVAPDRLALASPGNVSRIDTWTGLGFDLFDPHDPAGSTGDECASCRSAAEVAAAEGADAPIIIGAFDVATQAAGIARLDRYVQLGYGGALSWSWRGIGYPTHRGRVTRMPDIATWRLHYAQPTTGPRSRPLNPCYGPQVRAYLCPNLQMGTPANLFLGKRGRRTVLFSRNSLNSRGLGPASLYGTRDGRFTMAAKQVMHLRSGRTTLIDTGAKLLFKAIPGQYRYWKWNGAARMELWRLDASGRPVARVRVGPKTVYCLRDLKRTVNLPGAPRGRVFPACSQRLSQQRVTLGTSRGWSDIYPSTYHENWVDVTGLRGCFAYVHIADPTNVIYESNEDDNSSSVVVRLPWRGSNAGCPGAKALPTIGANGTY